jgi:DNA-directed RNA polymerase specialized sigma24 family protein
VTPRSQSISNRAEDLVQSAFTKLYLARNRVSRHEVLDAYVHQMLVRTLLDERRRGWWRRERVTDSTVEQPLPPDPSTNRLVMLQALAAVCGRRCAARWRPAVRRRR